MRSRIGIFFQFFNASCNIFIALFIIKIIFILIELNAFFSKRHGKSRINRYETGIFKVSLNSNYFDFKHMYKNILSIILQWDRRKNDTIILSMRKRGARDMIILHECSYVYQGLKNYRISYLALIHVRELSCYHCREGSYKQNFRINLRDMTADNFWTFCQSNQNGNNWTLAFWLKWRAYLQKRINI